MANDKYWNDLAGLYASVNTPSPAGMMPPQGQPGQTGQPPQAGQGPVQGYSDGGLVDEYSNPNSPESGIMGSWGGGGNSGGGGDSPWYMKAAGGFLGGLVPAAGAAATGMLIDKMFPGTPGKSRAVDLRQPEMQRGAVMAENRLANLQKNPNSFGLPGDPEDINTPAGQRMYMLRKNYRSAAAAGGRLETGGSQRGEADMINKAVGDEYNTAMNSGFSNLNSMTPQLQFQNEPGKENPWSRILTSALAPGVKTGAQAGMDVINKKWFI